MRFARLQLRMPAQSPFVVIGLVLVASWVGVGAVLAGSPPPAANATTRPTSAASQPGATSQPGGEQTKPVEPPKPTEEAPPEATSELNTDTIKGKISQVEAATDLPETERVALLNMYRQTLDQIKAARTWNKKIAGFEKSRNDAPADLAKIKVALSEAGSKTSTQPSGDVPADASLEDLTKRLNDATSGPDGLRKRQDRVKKLKDEDRSRAERRDSIPGLLTDANSRLEKAAKTLNDTTGPNETVQMGEARRLLLLATRRAIEAEIESYQEELQLYDARAELYSSEQELARLAVAESQAHATELQRRVSERRQQEIARQAEEAAQEILRAPRPVQAEAEKNRKYVEERAELAAWLDDIRDKPKKLEEEYARVDKACSTLSSYVKQPEMTLLLQSILRRARADLSELRSYERDQRATIQKHYAVLARKEAVESARAELTDLDGRVKQILNEITAADASVDPERLRPRLREILSTRAGLLDQLIREYSTYDIAIVNISSIEERIISRTNVFENLINQNVLWIPSAKPLYQTPLPPHWRRLPSELAVVGRSVVDDAWNEPVGYGLAVLGVGAMFFARRRVKLAMVDFAQRTTKVATDSYTYTLLAALGTLWLAAYLPILMLLLGWRLKLIVDPSNSEPYEWGQAIGAGLQGAGVILLILGIIYHLSRKKGLAESHFRWNPAAIALAHRHLRWAMFVLTFLALFVITTEQHPENSWRDTVGRVAFMAAMVLAAAMVTRLLRPSSGLLAHQLKTVRTGWLYRLRHLWYPLAILTPLGLAIASFMGYHYTAIEICRRLLQSIGWLVLGLLLFHSMMERKLIMAQRRLAVEQARRKREAEAEAQAKAESKPDADVIEIPPIDESTLTLVDIGDQTRRLLAALLIGLFCVGFWLIWSDMLPALSSLNNVKLWSTVVDGAPVQGADSELAASNKYIHYTTLGHLILAAVFLSAAIVLARNIPGLLEIAVLQKLDIDPGARSFATAVGRYGLIIVGLVLALNTLGVGWSSVQWLVAAMTVGLGFGLQEIFANFVSGIMLVFERPIRIGDTVTVGNVSGKVSRIRIRSTTITDWDRKELIIPNKEFITGQVINWTLSDNKQRIVLPIGVAYGSDVALVEKTLLAVARATPKVSLDPPPSVIFQAFGDSSLNFELRAFVDTIDDLLVTRHALNAAVNRAFQEKGIEIPFPQRDINVRSVPKELRRAADGDGKPQDEPTKSRAPQS